MIRNIRLKFGSTPNKPKLEFDTTPVTIFVGPNNSGKSKILQEIQQFCQNGQMNVNNALLENIEFNGVGDPEKVISELTMPSNKGEFLQPGHIIYGKGGWRNQVNRQNLINWLSNPNQKNNFCSYYTSFNTLRIDGGSRINLINQQPAGDLQAHPSNHLAVLFRNDELRKDVRRIVFDAFKKYFVIDPTNLGQLRIRLSEIEPNTNLLERGIHQEAIDFHNQALDISIASDGVKAFTGIIISIAAGDPKITLIDEPEAFLHPSLSYKLGKEVSNKVKDSQKSLIVSTHSSNFLMGCIQSGTPINVIRLTYSNNIATARALPSEKVLKLMRHPLLRSTGVLNGLFYEFVIVTESDADRAFYQEINERLLQFEPDKGIPNCLFINAQNKQTVHEIIRPLRELGIPCAGIVDVDIIKEGGAVWTSFLNGGFIPDLTIQSTATARTRIKQFFDNSGIDFKRNGGIDVLQGQEKEACTNLFDQLAEYGLFVVRGGELECWLKNLGATGHGPKWLIQIFEKLGDDSSSSHYIKPDVNDVWNFISDIKKWLINGNKKGIPE
jgi:ABC-type cobalamin/Fe3+-siderophores transport system ATPase subunit